MSGEQPFAGGFNLRVRHETLLGLRSTKKRLMYVNNDLTSYLAGEQMFGRPRPIRRLFLHTGGC